MAASRNMLDLLRLFTANEPAWRVERIARELRVSTATAYRYIAHLQGAGLVDCSAHGYYTLGPAFIEFDRLIRVSDPMLQVAIPRMQRLRRNVRAASTVQLWRCYRDCVVLVHELRSLRADEKRGKVVSLFSGAPSLAILAALPSHTLRRLFRKRSTEIETSKLGRTWRDFSLKMRAIDQRGWCVARSVLSAATSVASVIQVDSTVLGSVSVEVPGRRSLRAIEALGRSVNTAAGRIASAVGRDRRFALRRGRAR